jgi:hypothetical protein
MAMALHLSSRGQQFPRPQPRPVPARRREESQDVDRDYWIAHSVGYRVHDGRKRVGFVEETHPDPLDSSRTLLTVCAGVLGRRHIVVRSGDVSAIVPSAESIWVRTGAASLA